MHENEPIANDTPQRVAATDQHNIWVRALFMVLMAMIFQLCGTLLFIVAMIQFVIVLINKEANVRLVSFGRRLGLYLRQIANYLTFASDEIPFPFSDWPSEY